VPRLERRHRGGEQATIADIRSSLTPQSQEKSGTSLSDERAYELFEHSCSEEFAQSFLLYKLYARVGVRAARPAVICAYVGPPLFTSRSSGNVYIAKAH
jgi:hypothetical protein